MEDATFNLQAGQFYGADSHQKQGWLILEVAEHNKGGLTPLVEVQNQIQNRSG